jgi:hypothetical protein
VAEQYPTGYDLTLTTGEVSVVDGSIKTAKVYKDSLVLVLFKLKTSIYGQDSLILDYTPVEGFAGSLYHYRTQNNPNGGQPVSFYLGDVVTNNSNYISVVTNDYLSKEGSWVDSSGNPLKSANVSKDAENLYAVGVHIPTTSKDTKAIGNLPAKLERAFNLLQSNDSINLDVLPEAGLATIYAGSQSRKQTYTSDATIYDDNFVVSLGTKNPNGTSTGLLDTLGTSSPADGSAWDDYTTVMNQFVSFASDVRKDHVFISDPLRNIFVQGKYKTSDKKDFNFSGDIYWPLKNLFSRVTDSSYVVTYGNWIKNRDTYSSKDVWLPASGYVAAAIASSSQQSYPWSAVAGFSRGTLNNILDLGVNPSQKQRDLLYKINVNPIAFFPSDGYVIYGQKTLYRKPSAFDRLNVRRLFLTLEKETQALLKYFVFEPNSFTTRQRLVGALTPVFDKAKSNDGLYDYTIVCDERNNTPDVIDNNELRVSIYIQPVRTAEFILADFIATRTGINFNEVIG